MSFSELCLKRESTRSYTEKEVSVDVINEILRDAINSPSACNSQPWKFVVATGDAAKKVSKNLKSQIETINQWADQAPCFLVLCETKARLISALTCDSQHYAQIDIGLAASTICYSAADKNLGTCIVGCFDEELLKSDLNIDDELKVRLVISLGYPKHPTPRAKMRKDFENFVSYVNE